MERWLFSVMLVAAACGDDGAGADRGPRGPEGPEGAAGVAGATGPEGAAGGYAWFDAQGAQVTAGSTLTYWDDDGHAWAVDAETAELYAAGVVEDVYYDEELCTGDARVSALLPRFVYEAADPALADALPGGFMVRPDTLVSEEFCWTSLQYSGGCVVTASGECPAAVLADDLLVVQMPTTTWTPPLHPEPL